jgi:hypothetical protein
MVVVPCQRCDDSLLKAGAEEPREELEGQLIPVSHDTQHHPTASFLSVASFWLTSLLRSSRLRLIIVYDAEDDLEHKKYLNFQHLDLFLASW